MLVEARVVGRREQAEVRRLDWPDAPTPATAGDLVDHVVACEVREFAERRSSRSLLRVLTEQELADGAATGRIAAEVRPTGPPPLLAEAVAVAREAFADGLFLLFVDDVEVEDLDAAVDVRPDLRVRFVRLVPLAGGAR